MSTAALCTPRHSAPASRQTGWSAGVLGLASLMALSEAAASSQSPPSATRPHAEASHTTHETPGPLSFEIAYTADTLGAVRGGLANDIRYLDNLDLLLTADMERLFGLPRSTVHLYGLYNNGTGFTDGVAGDAQGISNIETGIEAARLYEAWIEYTGASERWSAKGGLYDLNSEFDALEASSLFMGSAHGIGTDIAQTGRNGPSIFPTTSLSLRLQAQVGEHLVWRGAVLDGVPGDPDKPTRTAVRLGKGDGALLINELDYTAGRARLIGGIWHYTGRFENHAHDASSEPVVSKGSNAGLYLRGEALLGGDPEQRNARGFFRLGKADGRFNTFGGFFSLGVTGTGMIRARPQDETGIALAWAETSRDYQRAAGSAPDCACAGREVVLELTHRVVINDTLAIQPNLQYVINPGLDGQADNLVAVGLRFELRYTR
jgi:porin